MAELAPGPLKDGDCRLDVDCPSMALEGMREPNPDWKFTDLHGHAHRWRKGKRQSWEWDEEPDFPSAAEIISSLWMTPTGTCRRCGAPISPGYRLIDPPPRVATGPVSWEGWLATSKCRPKSRWWKPFRLQTYIKGYRGRVLATSWEKDGEAGLWIVHFRSLGKLTKVA